MMPRGIEVPPAEQALGRWDEGGACRDCHLNDSIDWSALGWSDDPVRHGRPLKGSGPTVIRPLDLLE